MLTKKDRAVADRFRRRVAAVLPVLSVRAFGSRVRRRHTPDSDLDVFIEVESVTPDQRRRISEVAWEVGFEAGYVLVGEPKDATPSYEKIFLYVDPQTYQVRRVLLLDAQSNRNRFDFVSPEVNKKLPANEFVFAPPPGTQIIRP